MIQDVGTCQDCGKKLRIHEDSKNPITILTKDQLLLHTSENPDQDVSDLLNYPVCLECLDHMIEGVEKSIQSSEKVYDEYFKSIDKIDREIKGLSSNVKK